eukprot:9605661-Ditylum_brightwellii.AAC.1
MSTKRSGCAAVGIGENLYVVGGRGRRENVLSSIEVFNIATRKWTFLPPMSIKRFGCAAVGVGGNLYVIGGTDDLNTALSSIEVFNTSTREWSFLPPMSAKRFCCAAVGMKGNIYVIGGDDYLNNAYSTVEVLHVKPGSSLVTDSPPKEALVQQYPLSNRAIMGSASHQLPPTPSSHLPITMQSLQSKISTCNIIPVAVEVVQ